MGIARSVAVARSFDAVAVAVAITIAVVVIATGDGGDREYCNDQAYRYQ